MYEASGGGGSTTTTTTTTVKAVSGSTLSGIAKANGTTVAQILTDNPTLAARAAAGTTVLFNGTGVKITAPNTATNPYGANLAGQGAGLGTSSVPISTVSSVLTAPTVYPPSSGVDTSTLNGIAAASGLSNSDTGPIAGDGKILGENNTTVGQGPGETGAPPDVIPTTTVVKAPTPQVAAIPYVAPAASPPPPPPIKTAPIDTVQFVDDAIPETLMLDLLLENLGGQELLSVARYDTVNGQDVRYQPIKNLNIIQQEYNPGNLVKLQQTSLNVFNNFSIKFANKMPSVTNDPSGNNSNVWIDTDGSIVIELVHMLNDEQVEVQMAYDGTIYEAGI
jgi:LysM repeat protein